MQEPHIIAFGNPRDGFDYIGPFEGYDAALRYAEYELGGNDWWIVALILPASSKDEAA
jgi:hypothetical protein